MNDKKLLSRYGFRFEEKGDNNEYEGANPSDAGVDIAIQPFYSVNAGVSSSQGLSAGVLVRYVSSSALENTTRVGVAQFDNAQLFPNFSDFRWLGVSLCS